MNVIILHGTLGNPNSNWIPWLKAELEKLGHQVISPNLPTPDGQSPQNWLNTIQESVKQIGDKDLIFVAHSRSPLAVCQYLQTRSTPILACFFVAGFAKPLPNAPAPYPSLNNPFDDLGADWDKVKQNCKSFVCLMSDNDPYVPLSIAQDFATNLDAKQIIIPGGLHLSSNYVTFTLLLETILGVLPPQ